PDVAIEERYREEELEERRAAKRAALDLRAGRPRPKPERFVHRGWRGYQTAGADRSSARAARAAPRVIE
ncbi:hypothetical protein, partial [Salmonella enterica]|uniref:hypothetical protein n=1 Tax=Salmonella enterica TaxID=28901 RepID=UPI0019D5D4D2